MMIFYQCLKCLKQHFRLQRLAEMCVKPGLHAAFNIFIESICRKGNYRDLLCVLPVRGTDSFCRLQTIHFRHTHIHEYCIIIPWIMFHIFINSDPAVLCKIDFYFSH